MKHGKIQKKYVSEKQEDVDKEFDFNVDVYACKLLASDI